MGCRNNEWDIDSTGVLHKCRGDIVAGDGLAVGKLRLEIGSSRTFCRQAEGIATVINHKYKLKPRANESANRSPCGTVGPSKVDKGGRKAQWARQGFQRLIWGLPHKTSFLLIGKMGQRPSS